VGVVKNKPRRLSAEELKTFKSLVETTDQAVEEIAAAMGIKAGSIRNVLKESGYRVETRRVREVVAIVPVVAHEKPAPKTS
jgi:transposase